MNQARAGLGPSGFDQARGGSAYYNEIDPLAAQTIREAIKAGVIAPGIVDERDIRDIRPDELAGYTQVHLFAGGGIWSYALRRAGWPDESPIWTCSCPCQPFSTAGKGTGFDDERHLWPAAYWLIDQCRPERIAGEQVADKGADPWFDLVQADLEALGYAFGCVPLASAGFGAPNMRRRAFWMAHADSEGLERRVGLSERTDQRLARSCSLADGLGNANSGGRAPGIEGFATAGHRHSADADGGVIRVADSMCNGARPASGDGVRAQGEVVRIDRRVSGAGASIGVGGAPVGLADTLRAGRSERGPITGHGSVTWCGGASDSAPRPVNGFWRNADWLYCRDPGGPRWRPVDAGALPLAPGHPGRVGGLRVSGNAINAEVATGFIEAVMDHLSGAPLEALAA